MRTATRADPRRPQGSSVPRPSAPCGCHSQRSSPVPRRPIVHPVPVCSAAAQSRDSAVAPPTTIRVACALSSRRRSYLQASSLMIHVGAPRPSHPCSHLRPTPRPSPAASSQRGGGAHVRAPPLVALPPRRVAPADEPQSCSSSSMVIRRTRRAGATSRADRLAPVTAGPSGGRAARAVLSPAAVSILLASAFAAPFKSRMATHESFHRLPVLRSMPCSHRPAA